MYSSSIARLETDGIYTSTNVETATEGICRSKQHSHSSDATDRIHRGVGNAARKITDYVFPFVAVSE